MATKITGISNAVSGWDGKLLSELVEKHNRIIHICRDDARMDDLEGYVRFFAPDLEMAARMGRVEANQPLWKRLVYVAITRAERRLIWVVRNRLSKPSTPLQIKDLHAQATAPLALNIQEDG